MTKPDAVQPMTKEQAGVLFKWGSWRYQYESALAAIATGLHTVVETSELSRLRANQVPEGYVPAWQKPVPFTSSHPLDCLIVLRAFRQDDGWYVEDDGRFFHQDSPIAWCEDSLMWHKLPAAGVKS